MENKLLTRSEIIALLEMFTLIQVQDDIEGATITENTKVQVIAQDERYYSFSAPAKMTDTLMHAEHIIHRAARKIGYNSHIDLMKKLLNYE